MSQHTNEPIASVKEEVNDVLTMLLPWAVSALVHLGIVLLSVFVVWSAGNDDRRGGDEIIIPGVRPLGADRQTITLSSTQTPDGSPKDRLDSPLRPTVLNSHSRSIDGVGDVRGVGDPIGGAKGPRSAGPKGPSDSTTIGWRPTDGGEDGEGGDKKTSPFDRGVGGDAAGPAVLGPVGQRGNARKVVYVIDAGGALIDTFPIVLADLRRCVGALNEEHEFAVIFFQNDEAKEIIVPTRGLKRATAENRAKVIRWFSEEARNIVPQGSSNPMKAIKLALEYKPQLIFILSTGMSGSSRFDLDQKSVLQQITKVNTSHTKISTIQFIYPDKLERYGVAGTMERIAHDTGGTYKFVDAREVGFE